MTEADDNAKKKSAATQKPHDTLVRVAFSHVQVARDYVSSVLPPELVEQLDLSTIERMPEIHADPYLGELQSDVLLRVKLADSDDEVLICVVEHQSKVDPIMAARLLEYVAAALRAWRKANPKAKRVPGVIPVVLYNGVGPWTAPRSLGELYSLPRQAAGLVRPLLPELRYFVDDLRQTTDDAIEARPGERYYKVTLVVLRHGYDSEQDLRHFLATKARVLNELQDREDILAHARYILTVGKADRDTIMRGLERALSPENREVAVTAAEQLRAEGRVEGRVEGERRLLLRLLRSRFAIDSQIEKRIAHADEATLEQWADRVLGATSLDEVFKPGE